MIEIYTDGSSRGNPGPGGYGAILKYGDYEKEISQGYRRTTNNRMELMAVIAALKLIKKENQNITIYSDSKYVVDPINKGWLKSWVKKNFKGKKNPDLWKKYLKYSAPHQIMLVWVRGHSGHYENERCDILAVESSKKKSLLEDRGYHT